MIEGIPLFFPTPAISQPTIFFEVHGSNIQVGAYWAMPIFLLFLLEALIFFMPE